MKYILLIMTILQIKVFWNSFKGLFTTTKSDHKKVDEIVLQINSMPGDKNTMDGVTIIIAFFYAVFLTIYYILTGVYLSGIVFVSLSCLLTIKAWRNLGRTIKWLGNKEDKSSFNNTIFTRLYSVAYLSYIGYFIYFLIITW